MPAVEDQYDGAALWKLLHDGSITRVVGNVPGILELRVEIEHLREMFPAPGSSFALRLSGCTIFEYQPYGRPVVVIPGEIAALRPEILGSSDSDDSYIVTNSHGEPRVACPQASLFLEGMIPFGVEQLDRAAQTYWKSWAESIESESSN